MNAAVLDFEVYVLMTMKLRLKMSQKLAYLDEKLSRHELTVADGDRVRTQLASTLGDERSFFVNLRTLVDETEHDATSLRFCSLLWPEFDFRATAGADGTLTSARYWHARGVAPTDAAPSEVALWSTDIEGFAHRFGALGDAEPRPLLDPYFPAYQERLFDWDGRPWGVGFSWGLFMFAAQDWT